MATILFVTTVFYICSQLSSVNDRSPSRDDSRPDGGTPGGTPDGTPVSTPDDDQPDFDVDPLPTPPFSSPLGVFDPYDNLALLLEPYVGSYALCCSVWIIVSLGAVGTGVVLSYLGPVTGVPAAISLAAKCAEEGTKW